MNINFNLPSFGRVLSAIQPYAGQLAKIAAITLAGAGVAAGAGRALQYGGVKFASSPQMAKVLAVAGDKLFLVGKTAYLCVAVPLYTICWAAPKAAVVHGAPLAKKYVWIPLKNGIITAGTKIGQYLATIIQKIKPYAEKLGTFMLQKAKWVWNVALRPMAVKMLNAAKYILPKVLKGVDFVWKEAIIPLVNRIIAVGTKIGPYLAKIIQKIEPYAMKLMAFIVQKAEWAWNVVLPWVNLAKDKVVAAVKVILPHVIKAAQFVWQAVIIPTGRIAGVVRDKVVETALRIYNTIQPYAGPWIQALGNALSIAFQATIEAGQAAIQSVANSRFNFFGRS